MEEGRSLQAILTRTGEFGLYSPRFQSVGISDADAPDIKYLCMFLSPISWEQ